MFITTEQFINHVASLKTGVVSQGKDIRDGVNYGRISYGRESYVIGNRLATTDGDDEVSLVPYSQTDQCVAGRLLTQQEVSPLIGRALPCGLCCIIAGPGAGKSPLSHSLIPRDNPYYYIRAGEPFEGYIHDHLEVLRELARGMVSADYVILDSPKDLLSLGDGPAMKYGIARSFLLRLSEWSVAASNTRTTLIIPINPSSDDAETLAVLAAATASSSATTIVQQSGVWKYQMRTYETGPRLYGQFSFIEGSDPRVVHQMDSDSKGDPIWVQRLDVNEIDSIFIRTALVD